MSPVSSTALSGMAAAVQRLDSAAHNVANAQTPGYRRQIVLQEEQAGGGVTVSLGRSTTPGADLARDIVDERIAASAFAAGLQVVKTHDAMMGSLIDLYA
jgi:flagellar hook protein FlgE